MSKTNMRKTPPLLKAGLLIVFLIAAAFLAYFAYAKSHDFWVSYDVTGLPGFAIVNNPSPTANAEGTPAPTALPTAAPGPIALPWDGASRVTVLVMGLDFRDWESGDGPPRTDTMILLTLDPLTMSAGMLNIPRDLWVNIPGFNYGRINTAYMLGEAYQVPDGGPGLAIQTVEAFLGVPIDYYAQIDFSAFEDFVDELGGISVDVPYEMTVDPIGNNNTVILQPGRQVMDGAVALAYARARHTEGGDFDRADRTQQVILAIRERILGRGLPDVLGRAPAIYDKLAAGIHTNMALEDAIRLGLLALEVPEDELRRGVIAPPDQVLLVKSPDGTADVLKPIPDQIRLLRDYIFASSDMASPSGQGMDLQTLMQTEGARILILNGTYAEGLAASTQAYLQSQGANVTGTGTGEYTTYTRIIDYTGNPYAMQYLVDLMSITPYSISIDYDPTSEVDIVIVLGDDWAADNPMP